VRVSAVSARLQALRGQPAAQLGDDAVDGGQIREGTGWQRAVELTQRPCRRELSGALEAMTRIAPAMPGQLSSTAQDMARGKPSEIDHLNGFVARRGRELGIATPANQALHALVKLVEAGHGGG